MDKICVHDIFNYLWYTNFETSQIYTLPIFFSRSKQMIYFTVSYWCRFQSIFQNIGVIQIDIILLIFFLLDKENKVDLGLNNNAHTFKTCIISIEISKQLKALYLKKSYFLILLVLFH